jgi:RNA polymerase sigma-70 factor (ECF subfamily)
MQTLVDTAAADRNPGDPLERVAEAAHVLRAQQGDTESFTWLMVRHERPLLYYLRRFIAQPEAALDVHQEIWLAVFRGLPRLREPRAFRGWLYRLAHDRAARFVHDEIRDADRRQVLQDYAQETFQPPKASAETVHQALGLLSPPHREVLTLHYLRDLSIEEIATASQLSIGTVKSRLHYARLALRRLIERSSP